MIDRGIVFNIQKYSISDGPGIRTTVFLKGCPASCWWCHNPESQAPGPEMTLVEGRCLSCGECARACPHGTAGRGQGREAACLICGRCADACPTGARRLAGTEMTVADVLAALLKDRIFYEESGGGATFSGGEPLCQPGFLKALLAGCRERGIRTAVDTGGFAPRDQFLEVATAADLILYDLKLMDAEWHRAVVGLDNRLVLDNLASLGAVHDTIWIRVPIIPGVNDDRANLEATAALAARTPGVRQVNLLPYHRTWHGKLRQLGRAGAEDAIATPSRERMEELARIFRTAGLTTIIGG